MKRVNKIMFLVIALTGYTTAILSQNLDSMPELKRDSILTTKAKELVFRYGPEYYREYKKPIIDRYTVKPNLNLEGIKVGRVFYGITILYDTAIEILEEKYAVKVFLWADTGDPWYIWFGNGRGLTLDAKTEQMREELRTRPQIPYQQGGGVIRIQYESLDGSPVDKAKPTNIDYLKRRGYEYKDGKWVNPRQFISPNIDLLKRKGYEKREDGQWVKTKEDAIK